MCPAARVPPRSRTRAPSGVVDSQPMDRRDYLTILAAATLGGYLVVSTVIPDDSLPNAMAGLSRPAGPETYGAEGYGTGGYGE